MPGEPWRELDELVREHLDEGLRLALRLCGRRDDAEDILQEALLRVVQAFHTLRDTARFRLWFLRIVLSAARDWQRRKQRRREQTGLVEAVIPGAEPSRPLIESSELQRKLLAWIDRLPARQREALVLTCFARLTAREAAEVMETNEQNVRTLVCQARAKLKRWLDAELNGPVDHEC